MQKIGKVKVAGMFSDDRRENNTAPGAMHNPPIL